MTDGAATPSAM